MGVISSKTKKDPTPFTVGPVLYGHTYLSRVHTTVQCMTMCTGTVDGKKFAKRHSRKLSCNNSGEDHPLPLTFNVGIVGRCRTRGYANNVNFAKPTDARARQHWTSGQGGCHIVVCAKRHGYADAIYSHWMCLRTFFHQPSKTLRSCLSRSCGEVFGLFVSGLCCDADHCPHDARRESHR